jgi:uncharacterized membrane protein (UPF0127 family)
VRLNKTHHFFLLGLFAFLLPAVALAQQAFFSVQSVEIHPASDEAKVPPPENARKVLRGQIYNSDRLYPDGLVIANRFPENGAQLNMFSTPQTLSVSLQFLGVPRDLVLADESGRVTEILTATPYATEPLTSTGLVKSVLQLNAGEAKTYGIVLGERIVRREAIKQAVSP